METKEEWINKTMESLDGASRAESDPLLYEKVSVRIQPHVPAVIPIRTHLVWRVAALIVVLISLNILTLVYFSRSSYNIQNTVKSVANEYFSYIDTFNL